MKKIENDEKCFYCRGKGILTGVKGNEYTCSVCHGSGINYVARYKKLHHGNNECKYCGQPCKGYACESCLDIFEKENDNEDIA